MPGRPSLKLNPLTRFRMRAKVTQEKLAEKTKELAAAAGDGEKGVSATTINFLERGRNKARTTTIGQLVAALNALYVSKNVTEGDKIYQITPEQLLEITMVKPPLDLNRERENGEEPVKVPRRRGRPPGSHQVFQNQSPSASELNDTDTTGQVEIGGSNQGGEQQQQHLSLI